MQGAVQRIEEKSMRVDVDRAEEHTFALSSPPVMISCIFTVTCSRPSFISFLLEA